MDVEAEVLFKKGKRLASAYLQVECAKNSNPLLLNDFLGIVLDPKKSIDSWDTIDWVRWLIAGGKTPDEFAQTVRRYDNATTCGLVWIANFVAYRCRTCGISPCMSLCSECFLQGNHEGHDFNMFRSQAGGACDCGDTNVMKESGFCLKHGPKAQINKPQAPPDLLCVAEAMMPRIILRLIQHLREHSQLIRDFSAIQEADGFLTMLHQLSELGGAMRAVTTQALNNPNIYQALAVECSDPDSEKSSFLKRNYDLYLAAKEQLVTYGIPEEFQYVKAIQLELKHTTFLEELVFWTVRFEFPQKLVCFLLNMLPDPDYKIAFTQTFVNHYSRISIMLANSGSSDTLSNRVVHVSVQLFSNEGLALKMTQESHLLHAMVISIKAMMDRIVLQNTLQDADRNFHFVVDCSHPIMKDHCYWPVVSDLNNVLTHRPVAVEFLKDSKLLEMWFSFLSLFQGMNVNQRELRQHVEFEPNTYYAAFLAELEASATPMWALITHLKDAKMLMLTKGVIEQCLVSLFEWFDAIGMSASEVPNPYQVSFHLPLHRYLSVFLCQALVHQGASISEVLPSSESLKMIMLHPLQAQVAFHEILSGMWVRNGLQIKGQAMTYIQCHFCNSTVDSDLFLLQLCAGNLDPDWYIKTVFQRFQVWDWLSFKNPNKLTYLSSEQILPMLEGALNFLATLVDIHTNLGMSEEEITRQEMISLLCMNDRTHSQLMELLPEKCGTTWQNKEFETILSSIADYKAPNFEAGGNMVQGIYVPKGEIWENEFDPMHVLLRAVHKRDFQASVDRYTQYLRQSGKYQGTGTPWLPYRIPRNVHPGLNDPRQVLQCKTLHGVIFTILYRAYSNPLISEQIISLCVYLLEMSLIFPPRIMMSKPQMEEPYHVPVNDEVLDLDFQTWFPLEGTLQNIIHPIHYVVVPQTTTLSTRAPFGGLSLSGTSRDVALVGRSGGSQQQSENASEIMNGAFDNSLVGLVEEMEVEEEETDSFMDVFLNNQSDYEVQSPTIEEGALVSLANAGTGSSSVVSTNSQLALPSSSGSLPSLDQSLIPLMSRTAPLLSSTSSVSLPFSIHSTSLVPAPLSSQQPSIAALPAPNLLSLPVSPSLDGSLAIFNKPLIAPARLQLSIHRQRDVDGSYEPNNSGTLEGGGGGSSKRPFKSLPSFSSKMATEVHETLFTLLIRHHSKLSGKPDSYRPPTVSRKALQGNSETVVEDSGERIFEDSRVGDGTFFIGQMLDRVINLYGSNRIGVELMRSARQRIWPDLVSDAQGSGASSSSQAKPSEGKTAAAAKEERRRKARDRQQKLMAEFASRQKAFMEQSMKMDPNLYADLESEEENGLGATGSSGPNYENEETIKEEVKEYECIICGQTTPTTLEKPIGMVVLIQATSVLGHSHRTDPNLHRLPCSDEEKDILKPEVRLGAYMKNRVLQMFKHFDSSSWQLALNIGWNGGVHVQTCGHFLHMDCHKSYIQSLKSQSHQTQRQQNLAVDSGEYFCPLCRQLANSVLPLHSEPTVLRPKMTPSKCHRHSRLQEVANELGLIFTSSPDRVPATLKKMASIMEDLTVSTYPQYRSFCSPDSHSLYLFVCSIARTNLEVELLLRKGTLSLPAPKKSCFVPLFQVLSCNAKVLAPAQFIQWWIQLSGLSLKDQPFSVTSVEKEVPVFLRDASAILIQMILILPLNIAKDFYSCVVQVLFNLAYVQAVAQLSCWLSHEQRQRWKFFNSRETAVNGESEDEAQCSGPSSRRDDNKLSSLGRIIGSVVDFLEHSNLYCDDEELETKEKMDECSEHHIFDLNVQNLCLSYLRIAALLQSHLFSEELPIMQNQAEEFVALSNYLRLGEPRSLDASVISDSTHFLNWVTLDSTVLVKSWCQDMINFVNLSCETARELLDRPLRWHVPSLLRLPHSYNQIFQYYHRRPCVVCHVVPKDPSLCLICGALVCLRENCCRQQQLSEAVSHSISCGAGTAIFLTVNSSTIVVIRGKRACLWGSVYLDKFGEEDRDLKRGKPLYLSQERYRLLEHQWLSHSFDHTNKRWVWHRDNL